MTDLCEYELQILRECAGLAPASSWGAAIGEAFETLRARGYITRGGTVTPAGHRLLQENTP